MAAAKKTSARKKTTARRKPAAKKSAKTAAPALSPAQAELQTKLAELEELSLLLRQMKRAMFGRRSERLDPDQMQLALEDLEADIARAEAALPRPWR